MRTEIEEIVNRLVFRRGILLDENFQAAREQMTDRDIGDVLTKIIKWQKLLRKEFKKEVDNRDLDLSLSDSTEKPYVLLKQRFERFFEYVPYMQPLFILEEGTVKYNPSLSMEECEEIQKYIDDNYKVPMHLGRKLFMV